MAMAAYFQAAKREDFTLESGISANPLVKISSEKRNGFSLGMDLHATHLAGKANWMRVAELTLTT